MSLKHHVKKLLERLTGTHVYRVLPRGIDCIQDIATSLPTYRVDIVFDVGANVGQSVRTYLARFPRSHIYSFEPVGATFRKLQAALRGNERVTCHQLALGSSQSKGTMVMQGTSDLFFLSGQPKESDLNNGAKTESVDVVTLDHFCQTNGIDHISYLKVDTEGGDLDVLKGSVNMLTEHKIDFVEVEAGMNPGNTHHVPFEALKAFLESHGYLLFGIYEQLGEWLTREPYLRRTNPVFLSGRIIEMNRKSAGASA